MISTSGQSLIQQKRLQWAREREEMTGLCGLWGQQPLPRLSESRRGSLLPPIQKHDEAKAEESETSGYTSDSPLHDVVTKAQKQVQNEWRARSTPDVDRWGLQATPDTPDDRLKWGDRGVGVGHLWEPVPELPEARLPQVLESYRATPRWVERGLGLADGSKVEILEIHHQEEVSPSQSKYLLGQNVPLPPDVLEERERKRIKALQHQEAIRKQLEERERKRKEEKENRLREERLEEERIMKEREMERRRKEEEKEKEKIRRSKEQLDDERMREALKAAEQRASEEKSRMKKKELERVNMGKSARSVSSARSVTTVRDSWCQSEARPETREACSQCDGGLALVLDGGPGLALLMTPQRVVAHAATQTRLTSTAHTHSSRSDVSEKGGSCDRRSSQQRRGLRDRPKWGINRPTIQYQKQSEKDPHYLRRLRRRSRRTHSNLPHDTPLHSEKRLLPANTDDENIRDLQTHVLENGFRMDSSQSSPRFVRLGRQDKKDHFPVFLQESAKDDEVLVSEEPLLQEDFEKDVEEKSNEEENWMDDKSLDADADVSDNVENVAKSPIDEDDVVVKNHLISRLSALHVLSLVLMALKLDDFLSKKKEPAQVLDLSRVKISSQEDFKKYLERVPEYKIKPEKVSSDAVKIREKDWGVTPGRREAPHPHPFTYLDPTPPDMKSIKLSDLCPVTIDWKMLTTLRPKTKLEEDLFSRLVQLGKLDLKHQEHLKRGKDADWVRRTKNPRSSIVETRVLSCPECTEDFCDGSACCKLMYDNFLRPQASTATGIVKDGGPEGADDGEQAPRRRRRRGRAKSRGVASRRLRKNSIFNRPPTRGCTRDHSRRERHAAAVVRSRSTSRDRGGVARTPRAVSPAPRSKSAPRIHFKGIRSSSSGPSRSRSRSATDTENETGKRFVRACTLTYSESGAGGVWSDPYPTYPTRRYASRDTTSCESSDSDSSPGPPARILRPATVHLQLGSELATSDIEVASGTAQPVEAKPRRRRVTSVTSRLARVHLSLSADHSVQGDEAGLKRSRMRIARSVPERRTRPTTVPEPECHVTGHKYPPAPSSSASAELI